MAAKASNAFSAVSGLDDILKGLDGREVPMQKPMAIKRRKLQPKAPPKAAKAALAKAALAKAPAPAVAAPPEGAAPAVAAAPALAAPAVAGDGGPPALSDSRKCVTSRAYSTARTAAKAEGKSAAECKTAAQEAYKEAAAQWDKDHA